MSEDSTNNKLLKAEILSVKGDCHAGHKTGEIIELDCWKNGGLCGFFYHDIFPSLSVMQFGGKYPWSSADEITLECPDKSNAVTVRLSKL